MKKNAMLKIAAILMVAVLLTTCAISSTFAKYTTSATSAVEGARVAKFGVYLKTSIDGLFDENYVLETNDTSLTEDYSVVSVAGNVVAPGTEGEVEVTGTVTGQPEVAVKIETSATLDLTGWVDADSNDYCPLIFNVDGDDYYMGMTIDGVKVESVDALETAVINAIAAAGTEYYKANTDLSTVEETNFKITWSWDYTAGDTSLLKGYQNDVDDTFLGNKVVGFPAVGDPADVENYVPAVAAQPVTIAMTITQTITQVN